MQEFDNIIEKLFKEYSDYTSLNEGHYEYLMDKESFKDAVKEFIKLQTIQAIQDSIDIDDWSK